MQSSEDLSSNDRQWLDQGLDQVRADFLSLLGSPVKDEKWMGG